ncbi:U6 snRNA phosphodiesterase Usb1 [Aspergillus karnatakaensis]|uniref:HVSL domain-containing protein n=1 Tax=Aspergillus karnatakaensis TaxID=1810916 RepID=UPI003CCE0211
MALVQYSSSESDSEQDAPPRKINKQSHASKSQQQTSLPPLPASFHDLYTSSTRVSVRDDPSLHGGRKRAIPHVEGNWPTHVYLEWYPSRDELKILKDIISHTQSMHMHAEEQTSLHSFLHSDLGAQLPLHISLSRPVVLRTKERQTFLETFQHALRESDIPPFDVGVEGLHWVSNHEKTRWFYVLRAKRPEKDCLNRLLRISNRSLGLFGQPPLYEHERSDGSRIGVHGNKFTPQADYSDCFHVSIAWSLTEPSADDKERMKSIDVRELSALGIRFDCVKVKIGNNVSSLALG